MSPTRPSKRLAFATLFAVILVGITVGLGEALVRAWNPPPRRLKVRLDKMGTVEVVDGVTLWLPNEPRRSALEGRCTRDDFTVVVLGDSIFHGVEVEPPEVATSLLEQALRARRPDLPICVSNLAMSGYSLYMSVARGGATLDALAPEVVILELWGGVPRVPTRFDDVVYFFEDLPVDASGLANPLGLPAAVHRGLFRASRLYEYTVLAWPQRCPECRTDLRPHQHVLDDLLRRVQAGGGALVTVMPSYLLFPFEAQPDAVFEETAGFEAWTRANGVRNVRLWEAFAGRDPATMRLDGAHLNAEGQRALAEVFLELVAPHLPPADAPAER